MYQKEIESLKKNVIERIISIPQVIYHNKTANLPTSAAKGNKIHKYSYKGNKIHKNSYKSNKIHQCSKGRKTLGNNRPPIHRHSKATTAPYPPRRQSFVHKSLSVSSLIVFIITSEEILRVVVGVIGEIFIPPQWSITATFANIFIVIIVQAIILLVLPVLPIQPIIVSGDIIQVLSVISTIGANITVVVCGSTS